MLIRQLSAALPLLAAAAAWAAPPLTAIRDTVHRADGGTFDGYVIIEWKTFDASDASLIGRNRIQTRVPAGALNLRLVPTTNAASPAYYTVRYIAGGNVQFTEYWAVPPAEGALRVRDVRIADPLQAPAQSGNLTGGAISDIDGLQAALDDRPSKSATFAHPRAAIINNDGEIESAAGNPEDCVRVDGSAGPCGSAGSAVVGTFVDGETPGGPVNGSNTVFTLTRIPNPAASLLFYRNGVLQKRTLDYTLGDSTVTFAAPSTPQPGDVLLASYRTAGTGGTLPQVLCTGAGTATTSTVGASLGSCTIPANLLRPGDRLAIEFDYSHAGAAVGYQATVRFGASTVVSRTGPANSSTLTGRVSIGVDASGEQWSAQTWGQNLSLVPEAGLVAENVNADLTIDLRGSMAAATAESIALRNFTVLRYPAP